MGIQDFIESKNIRLDQQLRFTAEIDKMTSVYRRTMLIDGSRRENDVNIRGTLRLWLCFLKNMPLSR